MGNSEYSTHGLSLTKHPTRLLKIIFARKMRGTDQIASVQRFSNGVRLPRCASNGSAGNDCKNTQPRSREWEIACTACLIHMSNICNENSLPAQRIHFDSFVGSCNRNECLVVLAGTVENGAKFELWVCEMCQHILSISSGSTGVLQSNKTFSLPKKTRLLKV